MEQKKPMELGLQLLKDINIVRHNEFRFINAEFGFVTSFSKMETTSVSDNRTGYRKAVLLLSLMARHVF